MKLRKQPLLNVAITNATQNEVLEYVLASLSKPHDKYYIVTPNPEILVHATRSTSFRSILNQARIALPDGVGVMLAGEVLGIPYKERITGVDLMENLCKNSVNESKKYVKKPITVGFLGGRPGVAERTAKCLMRKYPGLRVGFAGAQWPEDKTLPRTPIDILFVAYGFPKQEFWMHDNLSRVPVQVAMGVGGAFDYLSGNVLRAPFLIRSLGLEWLFRLIRQPWRLKRQTALFLFGILVLKQKFSNTA